MSSLLTLHGDDYSALDLKCPQLLFYSYLNLSTTYFFYFLPCISTFLVPMNYLSFCGVIVMSKLNEKSYNNNYYG